eukprot:Nitzschia sp. Nitz4//scaffold79_size90958//67649//69877//NITZ4_005035-RA/size90958-processed-gene-0.40-mRNA-1//-1//CDS//3329558279//5331//frame0
MVRRVGGTIFQSVPATATAVRGGTAPLPNDDCPSTKTPVKIPAVPISYDKPPKPKKEPKPQSKPVATPRQSFKEMIQNLPNTIKKTPALPPPSSTPTKAPDKPSLPKPHPNETTSMVLGAKPSEIRAAAKLLNEKMKQEQIHMDKIRKREAEATMRIRKIRAEIESIKERERAQNEEALAHVQMEREGTPVKEPTSPKPVAAKNIPAPQVPPPPGTPRTPQGDIVFDFEEEQEIAPSNPMVDRLSPLRPTRKRPKAVVEQVKGAKALALEELKVERQTSFESQRQSSMESLQLDKQVASRNFSNSAMREMNESISLVNMPMDELAHFREMRNNISDHKSISTASSSREGSRHREYRRDVGGRQMMRRAPNRRMLDRKPSNHVPEMRRRANQRDLLFVEGGMDNNESDLEDSKSFVDDDEELDDPEIEINLPPPAVPPIQPPSPIIDSTAPPKPSDILKRNAQKEQEKGDTNTTTTTKKLETSVTAPAESVSKRAKDLARREEERIQKLAQKEELDQAKANFNAGHDLCWKYNDSANALVEYRKALYIRESILGKYHEETGRSYFWIGKSLTKLQEYEEALMAFSRSMRIFARVLKQTDKYNIWAATAVESVFRQMDITFIDFPAYKESLQNSIRHEQEGDQFRKQGKVADAIHSYREAIDHLEEHHPDSADLYCKIAILLRQQGEFDRALEEYQYASEIYEQSLGAEHPDTVKTLNQLIEKKKLNQKSMALMEKLKFRTSEN